MAMEVVLNPNLGAFRAFAGKTGRSSPSEVRNLQSEIPLRFSALRGDKSGPAPRTNPHLIGMG